MACYAIGDIQGCYEEFRQLLSLMQFNPDRDKVYLVGDLVNRGPKSLEVLRYVKQHASSIEFVLGNHDLHLLACWAGVTKPKGLDTLDSVFNAPDLDELMNWLRQQPLLLHYEQFVITHAGINPAVPFDILQDIARFCSEKLAGEDYAAWLEHMYGNTPAKWSPTLIESELFRFGINSLTRMRMLNGTELDLKFKAEPVFAPINLKPWFADEGATEKDGRFWALVCVGFNCDG